MSNKVMIVGTGNVGASIAFAMINQDAGVNELVLTDINSADAEGEAMDLRDALAISPSYMKITSGTYKDAKDCDIVIITAGAAQKPGETRSDLLRKNAKIVRPIVEEIMQSGFSGIFIVVTNPVDIMAYLTWKCSGLPHERVISTGTTLDSARLRERISEYLHVHPKSVNAYQVGEHGDTEFALWSKADVGGQPIDTLLSPDILKDIENFAKNEVYSIIKKKGATHYGISACVLDIVKCILNDEYRILPVSSYDDTTDTYNGFPAIVGKSGIIRRLELKLTETEGIKFQKSINALKSSIRYLS